MAPGLDAVAAEHKGTGLVNVGYWTSPRSVPRREINTHGPDPCRAWLPRLRYRTPGAYCIYWQRCRAPVESSWNVMAQGDPREGKWRGNWRMEWVASTLHTTSEHGVSSFTTADAHTSASSSRLNWRPRRFKWTLLMFVCQWIVSIIRNWLSTGCKFLVYWFMFMVPCIIIYAMK